MAEDSHIFSLLKRKVEAKLGVSPRTPNDFRALSVEIRQDVGQTLGVTTLKRLWGYVNNPNTPTYSTLTILSRYVGATDWDAFYAAHAPALASGFMSHKAVDMTEVTEGTIVKIHWGADKWCEFVRLTGDCTFKIVASHNVKLLPGDVVVVPLVIVGEPFTATNCKRGDELIGVYTSGRHAPVSLIGRKP